MVGLGEGSKIMKYLRIERGHIMPEINETYEGITIETKVNRITQSKEPITDGAPLIYTEKKDGVNPAYDVRTDRFEIALDAFSKIDASRKAKREARAEAAAKAEAEAAAEAEK